MSMTFVSSPALLINFVCVDSPQQVYILNILVTTLGRMPTSMVDKFSGISVFSTKSQWLHLFLSFIASRQPPTKWTIKDNRRALHCTKITLKDANKGHYFNTKGPYFVTRGQYFDTEGHRFDTKDTIFALTDTTRH